MQKRYIAKNQNTGQKIEVEGLTPNNAWRELEKGLVQDRATLKANGWRIKLKIDLEPADAVAVAEVLAPVLPKKVGGVIGIIKGLFGR